MESWPHNHLLCIFVVPSVSEVTTAGSKREWDMFCVRAPVACCGPAKKQEHAGQARESSHGSRTSGEWFRCKALPPVPAVSNSLFHALLPVFIWRSLLRFFILFTCFCHPVHLLRWLRGLLYFFQSGASVHLPWVIRGRTARERTAAISLIFPRGP